MVLLRIYLDRVQTYILLEMRVYSPVELLLAILLIVGATPCRLDVHASNHAI